VKKLVTMMVAALWLSAGARSATAMAAGDAPSVAPAAAAPGPGETRFVTRGGETVEGRIIDRLPNGYLVRMANDTTRVVAYEDVAAVEGAPVPAAPPPPPPQPVYAPPVYAPPPMVVAPAHPVDTERFGRPGQIILQQGFGFAQHTENRTTLALSPALDFLVTNHLTIGVAFAVSHSRTSTGSTGGGETGSSSNTSSSTSVGAALSLGLLFPVSTVFSLWPNIAGGVDHDFDGSGYTTVVSATELSLMFHPARHFFLALKPGVRGTRSLEGSSQSFQYSQVFATGIGGWW
jgi:hypothetical protein